VNMRIPVKQAIKSTLAAVTHWRVPRVKPRIVRTLQHDPEAFTQGLAYLNGNLYEASGKRPHSSLRCLDASSGQIDRTIIIPNDFAEGIAIQGNLLYQLSWKSERARVYSVPNLEVVGERRYRGEGWGLCSGPMGLAMSNGTGVLQFLDADFCATRRLRVTLNHFPTRRLNDLEWVGDFIYANVLFSNEILEVSVALGSVTRIIDCAELAAAAAPSDVEHVLNGIAYNPDRGTFFATGKCWGLLFEIDFVDSKAAED
jgi:glutaminyl-peptide cyclotransferase